MPAGLVHHHHDELVGVTFGDLGEEQRHRFGVDPWQDQAVEYAVVRAHGRERVEVLALQPSAYDRADVAWRPTTARGPQQPEAPFVPEHQPQAAPALGLARPLAVKDSAQFF